MTLARLPVDHGERMPDVHDGELSNESARLASARMSVLRLTTAFY